MLASWRSGALPRTTVALEACVAYARSQTMGYEAYENDSVPLDPSSPFFLDHVTRYWWAAS